MERLERMLARIDAANAADPERDPSGVPAALLYGQRMSVALARLHPDANEALTIAVRAQHVERWRIPRASYPEGRVGYLRWRAELGRMHAERAGELMRESGYDDAEIERVRSIVAKKMLATDPDAQALEDCACLVFLEHALEVFAEQRLSNHRLAPDGPSVRAARSRPVPPERALPSEQHDDAKVIEIVRKTWAKMSPRAHDAALALPLADRSRAIVAAALARG